MTEESRAQEIERRLAEGDIVVVHQLHDQFEEEQICQALDQDDIAHEVRRSYETAFSFLFRPQRGYGGQSPFPVVAVPLTSVSSPAARQQGPRVVCTHA